LLERFVALMAGKKRKSRNVHDGEPSSLADKSAVITPNSLVGGSTHVSSASAAAATSSKKRSRKNVHASFGGKLRPEQQQQSINSTIPISQADHDATLALLSTMDWHKAQNTSRRNVIRADDPSTPRNKMNKPYCMSFIFGRNMKDPSGGLSWWSTQYPDVYEKLRALMTKYDPHFSYTHITLNRNLQCKRHTDGGNAGPSYIGAFGNFVGGGLIVEPPGGGQPETLLDLHSNFVMFNGKTQPHETAPFTGERFTLVYYTSDIAPEVGAVDRRKRQATRMATADNAEGVSLSLTQKFREIKAKLGARTRR
jgi:hypothetical protein